VYSVLKADVEEKVGEQNIVLFRIEHKMEWSIFFIVRQPLVGQDLLNMEASRSQSETSHIR
jgi:hypothetical protein